MAVGVGERVGDAVAVADGDGDGVGDGVGVDVGAIAVNVASVIALHVVPLRARAFTCVVALMRTVNPDAPDCAVPFT
ncbi:MAG TPA: hypothetical protein PKH51_04625, partial [Candidatus Sumerlaeota bacterium]|nr:hypothetical protein [Candidatus Sumerlaeota bacterium]